METNIDKIINHHAQICRDPQQSLNVHTRLIEVKFRLLKLDMDYWTYDEIFHRLVRAI
jgi:hypothetical protein